MSVTSSTAKDGDATPLLFVQRHVDGVEAAALAEQAVVSSGNLPPRWSVAEVHAASLEAGLLLDEVSEGFADAGETRVSECVDFTRASDLAAFRHVAAFCNNNDAIVLPVVVVVLEQRADVVDVDGLLRHER